MGAATVLLSTSTTVFVGAARLLVPAVLWAPWPLLFGLYLKWEWEATSTSTSTSTAAPGVVGLDSAASSGLSGLEAYWASQRGLANFLLLVPLALAGFK